MKQTIPYDAAKNYHPEILEIFNVLSTTIQSFVRKFLRSVVTNTSTKLQNKTENKVRVRKNKYSTGVLLTEFFKVKMKLSFSLVISSIFVVYVGYSMYTFSLIFRKLKCSDETNCFFNFLNRNPKMQLALFSSTQMNPISTEVQKLVVVRNFDYTEPYSK
jgi:hypothetical protein